MPYNQSKFVVDARWGRDEIIRDIKSLNKGKKNTFAIEAIALDSTRRADAVGECADKCDYVLLTKILDFSETGTITAGPEGIQAVPPMIGNVDQRKRMGVDYSVVRAGHVNPLVDGRTAAPTNPVGSAAPSDNSAFEDAARQIASRVRAELQKQSSPMD